MQINDFTILPIGTQLESGEIRQCPKCGKIGLREQPSGTDAAFYTHFQSFGFTQQGEPNSRWEWCAVRPASAPSA